MTFNTPRWSGKARPIPNEYQNPKPMVAIPADEYERLRSAPANVVTTPSRTDDDGYRRYAKCLVCNIAYKIFTCYAQSDRHCKQFGPATHTHFSCVCNGGAAITMEGSVRVATKRDRIVFVPVVETGEQDQNNKE